MPSPRTPRRAHLVLFVLAAIACSGCGGGMALVGLGIAESGSGGGGGGTLPLMAAPEAEILAVASEAADPSYIEGEVSITYTLAHPDGARVRARVEFDAGGGYVPARPAGSSPVDAAIDVGPDPIPRTFIWSTREQGLPARVEGIRLRITAVLEGGASDPGIAVYPPEAETGLDLDNGLAPEIRILADEITSTWLGPAGIVAGDVRIPFTIADAEGDPAAYRAEVRIDDAGPDWSPFEAGEMTATAQGIRGEITWPSDPIDSGSVTIRIAAEDRYAGHVKAARVPAAVQFQVFNLTPEIVAADPDRVPAYGEQRVTLRTSDYFAGPGGVILLDGSPIDPDPGGSIWDEPVVVLALALHPTDAGLSRITVRNPNGRESGAVTLRFDRVVSPEPGTPAFLSLQAAIDDAVVADELDAWIHVLPGTYLEAIDLSGTSIFLRALAGTGDPEETTSRDYHILQGPPGAPVVTIDGGAPRLRGLWIEGGAGGILASDTDGLIVEDCVITGSQGPGIDAGRCQDLRIAGCLIERNEAEEGAGLLLVDSPARIEDTSIRSNAADTQGGAVSIRRMVTGSGAPTVLLRTRVTGNRASGPGGGIFVNADASSPVILASTLIEGNLASGVVDGLGGGIYMNSGALTLVYTTMVGNRAAIDGGGIYNRDFQAFALVRTILVDGETEDPAASGDLGGKLDGVTVESSVVMDPPDLGDVPDMPSFVDPGFWEDPGPDAVWQEGNYRLAFPLPVLDPTAFDPTAWGLADEDLAVDLDARPRGADGTPDIGAYGYDASPAP